MNVDIKSILFAIAIVGLSSCGSSSNPGAGGSPATALLPAAATSNAGSAAGAARGDDAKAESTGANGNPWRTLTAAYVERPASVFKLTWSYAHIALDYAWTTDYEAAVQRAAGMQIVHYADPHLVLDDSAGLPASNAMPSALAMDCDGKTPMTTSYNGSVTQNLSRPDTPNLADGMNAYIKSWQYTYDAMEADDAGLYSQMGLPFYSGGNGRTGTARNYPYCGYSDTAYANGLRSFYAALAAPVIVNALGVGATTNEASWMSLVWKNGSLTRNVIGVMCEACFANQTVGVGSFNYKIQSAWANLWGYRVQAIMSLIADRRKVVVENDLCATEIDRRKYSLASVMLAYDPAYVIEMFGQNCNPPSQINVMPETKFVPTQPLVTTSTLTDLKAPGGAYVREYAKCFLSGTPLGGCAVVVNPNADASVPMPSFRQSYTGTVAFSGIGIYGSVGDTGKIWTVPNSVPTSVGPTESAILVR